MIRPGGLWRIRIWKPLPAGTGAGVVGPAVIRSGMLPAAILAAIHFYRTRLAPIRGRLHRRRRRLSRYHKPRNVTRHCSRPLDIPVLKQLGRTHAYWELKEVDPNSGAIMQDFMISSGPPPPDQVPTNPATGKQFKDLNVYVHGPYDGVDQAANATWSWDSHYSSDCSAFTKMLAYAQNWQAHYNNNPTQGVLYSGFGPNSNSFAALLGSVGGLSPPRPPGATGWGYWPSVLSKLAG
jgi:hypothetical protein